MRRAVAVTAALVCAAGLVARAAADSKERRFWSARAGVGIEAPGGWTLSLHTGYPKILAVLLHPAGGRISLAVTDTDDKDANALVAASRPGLAAEDITVDRVSPGPLGGVTVDARAARRRQAIRQLYVVRGVGGAARQAIVVTLSIPAEQLSAAAGAFDWVIAHLALDAPADASGGPDAGPLDRDPGRSRASPRD